MTAHFRQTLPDAMAAERGAAEARRRVARTVTRARMAHAAANPSPEDLADMQAAKRRLLAAFAAAFLTLCACIGLQSAWLADAPAYEVAR